MKDEDANREGGGGGGGNIPMTSGCPSIEAAALHPIWSGSSDQGASHQGELEKRYFSLTSSLSSLC